MKKNHLVSLFLILIVLLSFSNLALANTTESAIDGASKNLDYFIGVANGYIGAVFFFDILWFVEDAQFPLLVAWLIVGAVFFTIRMGFINFRVFRHAFYCIRGRYSNPNDEGEVSHFQALTTALSATVGLGNIAGVAIALSVGGPGATFWMIVAGLLGMTTKFTEATLAQMYREVRPDGHIMGGAMEYLSRGFAEKGLAGLGKVLAIIFCVLCIGASLGGGNAFQANQSMNAVKEFVPILDSYPWIFGLIMAVLVGVVIIGGIRRIAHVAEAVVPTMVIVYVLAAMWIIIANIEMVPTAIALIVKSAFSWEAGFGGFIGVLVQGFKRAAFSNEAGIGSAAIAHSTARTKYPVREGIVALMEPFIDTVVVCTMTALVIVITGVLTAPEYASLVSGKQGAALTSAAFGTVLSWFPLILTFSVVLFAYSTMISWSYYGERCWSYMFGDRSSIAYKIIFIMFIVIGSVSSATNILDFSDLMLLSMAFPNLIALYVFSGKIKAALDDYMAKLRSGELDREVGR